MGPLWGGHAEFMRVPWAEFMRVPWANFNLLELPTGTENEVDLSQVDPTDYITDVTDGFGVDCGVEAVGYQAHDQFGHEHPAMTMDGLVSVVRATGHIGVVGVFVPADPEAATEQFDSRADGWTKVLLHPAA